MIKLNATETTIWQALTIDWQPGLAIMDKTGLKSAKFYFNVRVLEGRGLVESKWGEATKERGGFRPRLYRRVSGGDRELVQTYSENSFAGYGAIA